MDSPEKPLKLTSTDEEPSAKKQRLLCRSKKVELSEDEINSGLMLPQQISYQSTQPTSPKKKISTVSVSNVSNIDLRKMVTKSLSLEPIEQCRIKPIKTPIKKK